VQASPSLQLRRAPPRQIKAWQVSLIVHAFPSVQFVPLALPAQGLSGSQPVWEAFACVPVGHCVQELDPCCALKVLPEQAAQGALPVGLNVPGSQIGAVVTHVVWSSLATVPLGHA
jgi:hypothetical protein